MTIKEIFSKTAEGRLSAAGFFCGAKRKYAGKEPAFTLAEVLITLTIIGVAAAMTITVVIGTWQKSYTISQLQKVFSIFEQSFRAAAAFNYECKYWDMDAGESAAGAEKFFNKYMKPYLHIYKYCGTSNDDGCDFTFKNLKAEQKTLDSGKWIKFFLNDGSFIAMAAKAEEGYKTVYFYVDINGKKPLNVVSRDIFYFEYMIDNISEPRLAGRMLPLGYELERAQLLTGGHGCSAEGDGLYCGALIIKDGWQILGDYPWSLAAQAYRAETQQNSGS